MHAHACESLTHTRAHNFALFLKATQVMNTWLELTEHQTGLDFVRHFYLPYMGKELHSTKIASYGKIP